VCVAYCISLVAGVCVCVRGSFPALFSENLLAASLSPRYSSILTVLGMTQ
jgi:hypothetical protein